MKVQRLAAVVLFLILAELVSVTAGEVLRTEASGNQTSHTDGTPRPAPGDDSHPFGQDCGCTCCPECAAALAFVAPRFSFRIPRPITLEVQHQNDLNPKDIIQNIFRPPRA
jgi:hypothetical protein